MAEINVLDDHTIDKIAAGEVVERPASVVKELIENAIDAGADAITVEIKEGGISFIRVTDNGCGIEKAQVKKAFLRHATSKIRTVEDLLSVSSLGFRGEALSSIGAVSQVEVITKEEKDLTGIRYILDGGKDKAYEEIGAPKGTTILVRNLFFNTPARRKFLKSPATEGSYISDLLEHMAMSKPKVSFQFIHNNKTKFHTSGNGDLKEIVYRIYGRDIAGDLLPIQKEIEGIEVTGFLGKPTITRANRNYENYFVNGRYIKSDLISKAIETGYHSFLMQHKYPFTVLHLNVASQNLDVNVHPTKMDIRFTNQSQFYDFMSGIIVECLLQKELIPQVSLDEKKELPPVVKQTVQKVIPPQPFERKRMELEPVKQIEPLKVAEEHHYAEQLNLFDQKLLSTEAKADYRILGQIFATYWLVAFSDKLFIVDQHAAHEKVKYERLIQRIREKNMVSQTINPPIILTLTGREESLLKEYLPVFTQMGFEVECFGGNEYTIRSVPTDLYGCDEQRLFLEILDELADGPLKGTLNVIEEKMASMACKAAVKGNMTTSMAEMNSLLDQLLELENPYNCPHGRPTIISMSKYEIDKKFKRIL